MTTVMQLYMRALTLAAFVLLILILLASAAFAQDAITVDQIAAPAEEGYTGLAGLANSALAAIATTLALLITAVVTRLWGMIPVAFQAMIDKWTTGDSKEWRENIRESTYDALVHAMVQLKIDPKSIQSWEEKSAFLKVAGGFIERFDPEIKALATDALDKDRNGVPDFLEIALAKIAPQTAFIAAPAETQGFMSRPQIVEPRRVVKARASDAAVEALAQKFSRRPKGTVTQ